MKRAQSIIISTIIFCHALLFTPALMTSAVATANQAADMMNAEVQRGIAYGFVPTELQSDWEATITYSQCCEIISRMLSLYDASALLEWEEAAKLALTSDELMQRDEGILALYYGAIAAGLDYYDNEVGYAVGDADTFWDGAKWDYPLFPQWQMEWTSPSTPPYTDTDYFKGAAFFAAQRLSFVNGKPLFDIDNGVLHFGDPLTREDMVQAVVRLYESDEAVAAQMNPDYGDTFNEMATKLDDRRTQILQSETSIIRVESKNDYVQGENYFGKAYYVSSEGNDKNNGQSPEKPWASLKKVNAAKLKTGDAVFFHRGDIFRGVALQCKKGVTYSAYGEGSKPIITLSPEDGASEEKWTLYHEGAQGEKIWVFYRELEDCGGIFFHEGEQWGNKIAPRWREGQFWNEQGRSFDPALDLKNDLDFFSKADSTLPKAGDTNRYDLKPKQVAFGPLYLRCDAGNPGSIFQSIEFSLDADTITGGLGIVNIGGTGAGSVVDNLSIRYGNSCGIGEPFGCIVQNCEIAYVGGKVLRYHPDAELLFESVETAGDGVGIGNDGGAGLRTIRNNYIHDCYQNAITIEMGMAGPIANIDIRDNVLEKNHEGIQVVHFWPNADEYMFSNISIRDNVIAWNGYGWGSTQSTQGTQRPCGLGFGDSENPNENLVIAGNDFFLSKSIQLYGAMPGENAPTLSNNTFYVWFYESLFAIWHFDDWAFYRVADADNFLNSYFGDSSNTVVPILKN